MLLRLVQVGDGIAETRRRVDRDSLLTQAPEPNATAAVLDALARARLVTADAEAVEITHEALLGAWPNSPRLDRRRPCRTSRPPTTHRSCPRLGPRGQISIQPVSGSLHWPWLADGPRTLATNAIWAQSNAQFLTPARRYAFAKSNAVPVALASSSPA